MTTQSEILPGPGNQNITYADARWHPNYAAFNTSIMCVPTPWGQPYAPPLPSQLFNMRYEPNDPPGSGSFYAIDPSKPSGMR